MIKQAIKSKWIYWVFAGVLTLFVMLPVGTASAQIAPDPTHDPVNRLEYAYQRLQINSDRLQFRFQRADKIMERGDEWVAWLQERGIDTTELEAALALYAQQVADARVHADAGAAILAEHAGFDDDGQVTDVETAVDTLRSARAELLDGHHELRDATHELHDTVKEIRQELRGGE